MSTHITGKLILAGDYTEEEQIDPAEPLARVVVVMTREQLRDVATLPMYEEVTVIRSDELAALRAEVERLTKERDGLNSAMCGKEREEYNAALVAFAPEEAGHHFLSSATRMVNRAEAAESRLLWIVDHPNEFAEWGNEHPWSSDPAKNEAAWTGFIDAARAAQGGAK